ncbi:hypothetical protein CEXT_204791 [Caerostris extrusa]|uniref:Uncharacterized protein n=1 Tax=Caerostris extrusa TaxID=172846 RepID=A0AAV4VK11_CAEEX|nr:hypothetical protein CEXT_204791 [Caerostris extrusa]
MSRPDSRLAIKQVTRWTNRSRRVHQKYEECHRRRVRESSPHTNLAASRHTVKEIAAVTGLGWHSVAARSRGYIVWWK